MRDAAYASSARAGWRAGGGDAGLEHEVTDCAVPCLADGESWVCPMCGRVWHAGVVVPPRLPVMLGGSGGAQGFVRLRGRVVTMEPSSTPKPPGELWERTNSRVPSNAYLRDLIHDAEIEAGEEDGDCRLSLGRYTEGVLAALRELEARRHAGA